VQVGGIVTGESMFHRRSDASKVAMLDLLDRLGAAGGLLLDVQLLTDHLATPRGHRRAGRTFLTLLHAHRDDDVRLALDRRSVTALTSSGTLAQVRTPSPAFPRRAPIRCADGPGPCLTVPVTSTAGTRSHVPAADVPPTRPPFDHEEDT
jgi:hypothetical protein